MTSTAPAALYGWETPDTRPIAFVQAALERRIAGPALACCGTLHPCAALPFTCPRCGRQYLTERIPDAQ